MQLKYNRQQGIGSSIGRILIKIVFILLVIILAIFLIEKINFPSPGKTYKIEITDEIKKLK
jgi:flagellar biogenesis protein FliO